MKVLRQFNCGARNAISIKNFRTAQVRLQIRHLSVQHRSEWREIRATVRTVPQEAMFRHTVLAELNFFKNNGSRARGSQAEQARIDAPTLEILSYKVPCNIVTQSRNRRRLPSEECETTAHISARTACVKFRSRIIKSKNNIQSTQPGCY